MKQKEAVSKARHSMSSLRHAVILTKVRIPFVCGGLQVKPATTITIMRGLASPRFATEFSYLSLIRSLEYRFTFGRPYIIFMEEYDPNK